MAILGVPQAAHRLILPHSRPTLQTRYYPRRPRLRHQPTCPRLRPGCMFSARRTSNRTSSKWLRLWHTRRVWRDNRAGCPRGEKCIAPSPPRREDHCGADLATVPARPTPFGQKFRGKIFPFVVWEFSDLKTDAAALHHGQKNLLFLGRVAGPDKRFEIGPTKAPTPSE